MDINSKDKFKLKKFLNDLRDLKGRHTELVSVYIPQGYELVKIVQHLQEEQGTATNIKSKTTQKNVVGALEKMIQHLKIYKATPEHGLAVFSGNVSAQEGKDDFRVWSIEPPLPVNIRLYRCDKQFVLDPLEDMMQIKEVYGLIVMDRRDGMIALLKGKTIIPLVKTHSEVPGKMRAGGQSAHRYEMNRELSAKDHYKKIGDYAKEQFLYMEGLKGIIVGGPGPTKYTFAEGNFITDQVKKKIIGIKDLSYTGEFGLQELVDRSQDLLANEEIAREKKIMEQFFTILSKDISKVAYGEKHVFHALEMGAVDTVLVSEVVDDATIEKVEEEAAKTGSVVELISTDTREGVQLRDLGKLAAILRFPIHN